MLRRPNFFIPLLRFRLVVQAPSINTKYSSPIMMNTTSPLLIAASQQATTTRHHQSQASSNTTTNMRTAFEAKRRQRELSVTQKLLELYNNASPFSDNGPKPPQNDAESATKADDNPRPSALRAGIDSFLKRSTPPLDPRDFFEKVALWMEEPKKIDGGFALYRDLCTEEKYFKSRSLGYHDDDVIFFQDLFFDKAKAIYNEIQRSQAKTLGEIFEGQLCPIFPNHFPPTLCLPLNDKVGSTAPTFCEVQRRHADTHNNLHVPRLKKRDEVTEAGQEYLRFTENNLPVVWQTGETGDMAQQVIDICSLLGHGKTVASFEIGHLMSNNRNNNINNNNKDSAKNKCYTFYFTCAEVIQEIGVTDWEKNGEECRKLQASKDQLEKAEREKRMMTNYDNNNNNNSDSQKLDQHDSAIIDLEYSMRDVRFKLHHSTKQRNNLVSNAVQRMVKKSVASVNSGLQCIRPSSTESSTMTHVNIIIDEMGSDIRLLRALSGSSNETARRLHRYLFISSEEADPPKKEPVRVHFIAARTGSHFTEREVGSASYPVGSVYLTPQKTIFKTLLEEKNKEVNLQSTMKELYERLLNATEATPPQPFKSAVESILADLITNPRCAALLVNEAAKTFNSGTASPLLNLSSHTSVAEVLTGWVRTTITSFVELNGLHKEIISFALAFVVLRFPEMPDCPAIARLLDPESKALFPKLFTTLCIDSGLIVDKIYSQELGDAYGESKYFPFQNGLTFDLARGRYECSPAFAAMFKFYFCLGQKKSESPERRSNVADACVLITKYSMSLKTVDDDLREGAHEKLYRSYLVENRARLEKFDPLFSLKKEWLIYPASACVGDSRREQLDSNNNTMTVDSIDNASPTEKKNIIDDYRGKIFGSSSTPFSTPFATTSTANSTVVMISAEKDQPFADVIVAGPGRLILLQSKRLDASGINFDDELGKMGALSSKYAKNDKTKKETWRKSRNYVNFLKEFCKKNEDDPVEVFAGVILETDNESILKACQDKYNKRNYKTNFEKLGFFGYSITRNSIRSRSPLYPLE